jgi:uncharacterized metal-binding protein
MAGCCCGGDGKKNVLLYSCAGGANVGEVSERAARELMFAGQGTMFCLAGIAAGIPAMVQQARDADLNLILEGCPLDCAKNIFDNAGLKNYVQIKVTDLGIEKKKPARATDEQVAAVVAKAREAIAKA